MTAAPPEPTTTRTGKIASLPWAIREELCRRLRDGGKGPALLAWLNARTDVRAIIERDYEGVDVSAENLSQWRLGGYRDWLGRREDIERKRELAIYCAELGESGKAIFAGGAAVAGGKLMEVLESVDVQTQKELLAEKPETIIGLVEALTALQGVAVRDKQLEHAERRLDLAEKQFQDRFLEGFLKYYEDRQAKDIAEGKGSKGVKMDQLRRLIFGARPELAPADTLISR